MGSDQMSTMIDTEVWKTLDIIHRRTRMPKKHLIALFTKAFVDSEDGGALLRSLGVTEADFAEIQQSLLGTLVLPA